MMKSNNVKKDNNWVKADENAIKEMYDQLESIKSKAKDRIWGQVAFKQVDDAVGHIIDAMGCLENAQSMINDAFKSVNKSRIRKSYIKKDFGDIFEEPNGEILYVGVFGWNFKLKPIGNGGYEAYFLNGGFNGGEEFAIGHYASRDEALNKCDEFSARIAVNMDKSVKKYRLKGHTGTFLRIGKCKDYSLMQSVEYGNRAYNVLLKGNKIVAENVNGVDDAKASMFQAQFDDYVKKHKFSKIKKDATDFNEGDIIYATSGYDMTLVDFFQIVGKTAKKVRIKPIKDEKTFDEGHMAGHCVPKPNEFTTHHLIGDEKLCSCPEGQDFIIIDSNYKLYGYKWNGQPMRFNEAD